VAASSEKRLRPWAPLGTLRSHASGRLGMGISMRPDIRLVTKTRTLRVYPLADARAVTLPPPVHTKLSCIPSRMATQRDVENNQMFLNACVLLLHGLTNHCSNSDPLLQPRSLDIAKLWARVRQSFLLCSDIDQEPSWNSTQIDESHGRVSLGLSEQRVEVTGSCSLINPSSLTPR
jgi:hypothetical protein